MMTIAGGRQRTIRAGKEHMNKILGALWCVLAALLTGFWSPVTQAKEFSEFDLQIIDVANKYTAAAISAKLCGHYRFEDKAEEARFNSNLGLSRIYVARIFVENFPGIPQDKLIARAEQMDRKLNRDIGRFHAEKGCSHELIVVFLKWFSQLKKLPQMPYPESDIEFDAFRTMASSWLEQNRAATL
ncbi:hypothetical protein KXR53_18245 [Inquilinus limosus]|uniref:hypothetical protein n=1 Tax=Inquilinus limosus TaxID=171674 RepID=UPI003F174DB2